MTAKEKMVQFQLPQRLTASPKLTNTFRITSSHSPKSSRQPSSELGSHHLKPCPHCCR